MTARGLTLLELLAATLILAVSASVGVRVISGASEGVKSAQLAHQAQLMVSLYERERIESGGEGVLEPWEHRDANGTVWRVRIERLPLNEGAFLEPRMPALEWEATIVEAAFSIDTSFDRILTKRRLIEAAEDVSEEASQ